MQLQTSFEKHRYFLNTNWFVSLFCA